MTVDVDVGGRVLRLSTLDRVMWPGPGVTKRDLIDYYVQVADVLLPHLAGRPVTLHRFPEGLTGRHFFQTRCPPHPRWLRTVELHYPRTGKTFEAPVVDDLAGLVWAANLSTVEMHPFLSLVDALDEPTHAVVDLDPGPPAGRVHACAVALRVRHLLADAGLVGVVKTSGGKGMHVVVPLAPGATYDVTKAWVRDLARTLTAEDPGGVIDVMTKARRPGRVFVDWSQNDPGKSTVAPYSLRAGGVRPTVSLPVTWAEVEAVVHAGDDRGLPAGIPDARARLDRLGDLAAPALRREQSLPPPGGG